jgi:dihydrofolate reductase
MISIIAAMTEKRVIGKGNDLPWNIPEDLANFKKITSGHPIVMGRNTYLSIGRPLPGRLNIVLSRQAETIKGVVVAQSLPEAIQVAKEHDQEVFIIGGANVYAQALGLADRLCISFVHEDYEGDVLFPKYDESMWRESRREEFAEFTYVEYLRK